jgi:thiopeptide-type bacteriocin biosynthesis protein
MLRGLHQRRVYCGHEVLTEGRRAAAAFVVCDTPAVLARVPLRPAEMSAVMLPDAVEDGLLAEALFLASRHAASDPGARTGAPGRLGDGGGPSRSTVTRRAYELRSRWRPTPHGAFAGVATARAADAGEPARLLLGSRHRARTGPSGSWLAELAGVLLADSAVVGRLRLTTSNLVVQRGGTLEHQWRARRVTARATEVSQLILRICADGVLGSDAAGEVMRRWQVPDQVARSALAELARGGFLLTDLLPGDITSDPLGHLLGKIPPGHVLTSQLERLRRLLAAADHHPVGDPARLQALTTARDLADDICLVDRPLGVDVAADADIVVPASLLDKAAQAATVLCQAADLPTVLADWHERFVKRYGPDRLVPLLEATDAAIGLGIDPRDIEPPGRLARRPWGQAADEAARASERRNEVLAALVADALAHGSTEVALDEDALMSLADGRSGLPACPAEISVRVIASGRQELAAGQLRLAVVPPGPQEAGATIGRFAGLLPGAWPGPPAADTTALTAEIVVQSLAPQGAALAPPAGFAGFRIPVGIPSRPGGLDLDLDDLHLISDGRRLSCWSVRHDRQVIPVLYSRLAPPLLPPVARFLQLLGRTRAPVLSGWSWGPLAAGPFQPRVRHGQVILAPARWVLPPSLTETAGERARWGSALDMWRATAAPRPPEVILTDDGDRRLPLDLRHAEDRELLRRYVRRGLAAVCEPPGGPDAVQAVAAGPDGPHILELVVPVQPRTRPRPDLAPARPLLPRRAGDEGLFLPGGPWLSVFLCAPRTCQDQILQQLEIISSDLTGHFGMCFWLRYADPPHGPHLRIRFHGDPAALGGCVLPALSKWCTHLRRQRLAGSFSIEPYDQEIERYGGPGAITAAERVFAADSRLSLVLLTMIRDPDQRLTAAAMSAAAISTAIADGDPAALDPHHLDRAARHRYQAVRPWVRAAVRSYDLATLPGDIPAGDAADAWAARHETLTAYRAALEPAQRAASAAALTHMHANRLLGDAVAERIATALAADLLALRQATTPTT